MAKKSTFDDTNSINDIIADIAKDFKEAKLGLTINSDDCEMIPTGIDLFDTISGGGYPVSKFVTLTGSAGCGKSTLGIAIGAAFQRADPNSIFYLLDVENSHTKKRLAELGVDINRLALINGSFTTEMILPLIKRICERKKENGSKSRDFCLWDSESQTVTGAQVAAEDSEKGVVQPAIKAKQLAFIYPRLSQLAVEYDMTIGVVSHLRTKINLNPYQTDHTGVKGLGNYTITGASSAAYSSSQIVLMTPKEKIDNEKYPFNGTTVDFKFVKNRFNTPNISGKMVLNYEKGFDPFWSKYILIKDAKLIKSVGGRGPNSNLNNYPEFKFYQMEAETIYNTNPEFKQKFDELYEKVKNKLLDPNAKKNKDIGEDEELETTNDIFDEAEDIIENDENEEEE